MSTTATWHVTWNLKLKGLFIAASCAGLIKHTQEAHLLLSANVSVMVQWSLLTLKTLCVQLSFRRQQITERLNEWAVFNDKYKELCEWLTNMESKVSQNGDISIEEMIEKLHKVNTYEWGQQLVYLLVSTVFRKIQDVDNYFWSITFKLLCVVLCHRITRRRLK